MSYRELRNFKEIMCTLGYPRLISIENFKVPHFELVADILVWLCQRYDKNMEILDEIRTEHDRVAFLKSVAEQLLVKARVKLNIKNLYSSNGFAVRELLKIATLLHDAHRNATLEQEDDDNDSSAIDIGANKKFADIKLTRSLSADITKYGSRLHELLGSHAEAKDSASRALGKNFDVNTLQRQLLEMNSQVAEQTDNLRNMLANLASDEQNMQQRIDKKRSELERHEKRFASLKAVRPAFMDEYERLEVELSAHYSMYVQSWRNLSYLESELDELNATEEERIAENDRQLKLMQRRLRDEELRVLRGQTKVDERALDEALMAGDGRGKNTMKRPGAATVRRDGTGGGRGGVDEFGNPNVQGNMYGGMAPIDDDDEEEDDDDDLGDDDDDDLDGEDDEMEGEEDSDGQVEFTHQDDDELSDEGDDTGDFGDGGEEDDDF